MIRQITLIVLFFNFYPSCAVEFDFSEKLLHYSVNGFTEGIIKILKDGVDVNSRDQSVSFKGETPLMKTAINGDIKNTRILLEHGADINAQDQSGETALLSAAFVCHLEMVKFLYDHGADINLANNKGYTALLVAADRGYDDIVHFLLEKGAQIKPALNGYNIIMATSKYQPELMEFFLKNHVDPNAKTNKGQTALMEAVCSNNLDSIKILLKYNASLYIKDNHDRDILYYLLNCHNGFSEETLTYVVQSEPDFLKKLKTSKEILWKIFRVYTDERYLENLALFEKFVQAMDNINMVDENGLTFLDQLGLQQEEVNPAQGSSSNHRSQHIEKVVAIIQKYGGLSAHQKQIQMINEFNKKMEITHYKITDEIKKDFNTLTKHINHDFINHILHSLKNELQMVYFKLYAEQNEYFEDFYHVYPYVNLLCKINREKVLIDYYEKNYTINWPDVKNEFQRNVLRSCSTTFMNTLIKRNDKYLFSANGLDLFSKKNFITTEYPEKLNILIENKNKFFNRQTDQLLIEYFQKKLYVNKISSLDFKDDMGNTLLHTLLAEKQNFSNDFQPLNRIDYLIFQQIFYKNIKANVMDVNAVNKEGKTLLMYAAYKGYFSVVKMLVENGANVDIKDVYGQSAMFLSTLNHFTSIARYLSEKTNDKNSIFIADEIEKEKSLKATVLEKHNMAFSPEIKSFVENQKFILDVNITKPPVPFYVNDCRVYQAVEQENKVQLNFLLETGYSPDCAQGIGDSGLSTALERAIFNENEILVKTLLQYGASVNERSARGYIFPYENIKNPEIIKMLKEKNIKVIHNP